MELNTAVNGANGTAQAAVYIKDSTDRAFKVDVIDASREAPVMVDFWAPWCGPCRQLTPSLEKVVGEKKGAIRLVKVNIDENPAIAGQLGIQSIPAVFAFAGGRPVDAFLGAIPESEVRRFAERVIAAAPPAAPVPGSPEEEIKQYLDGAAQALAQGDLGGAVNLYAAVLQRDEQNVQALIGIARTYIKAGEAEPAQQALALIPEAERKGEDYTSAVAALKLMQEAAALVGAKGELERRLEKNPDDHQARFDLAVALNAEGKRLEAAEQLVASMKRDRTWEEERARKKLLEFFDAWGPKDPATLRGRRLLSALLFS
jgi:putative thioredoxin